MARAGTARADNSNEGRLRGNHDDTTYGVGAGR